MQKESHKKLGTLLLVLVFLIGLFLAVWPIAKELSAYQKDEDEYEAMAEEWRPPETTPVPALPVQEVTANPTDSSETEPTPDSGISETVYQLKPEITAITATAEPACSPWAATETEAAEAPTPAQETVVPETDIPVISEQESTDEPEPASARSTEKTVETKAPFTAMPTDTPEESVTAKPTRKASAIPTVSVSNTPAASIPVQENTAVPESPVPTQQPRIQAGTDLEACLAQNRDFVAWITIPGTKINYPVVRSNDTEYYLHHLFSGKESKLGCLFSLKSSDYQKPSRNIAIYGHHLSQSDAMFSTLLRYKDSSYCSAHSMIQLDTLYGSREYRIFAVINMAVTDWDAATASFSGDTDFLHFVNRARQGALYETGVTVTADDHILTLITCDRSYGGVSGRLVVMAVQQ